jgi:autotransporter-associated beta strand protein
MFALMANYAGATILYWNNNGSSTPTSGTWDTTSSQWSIGTAAGGTKQAWATADAAAFRAGAATTDSLTITVNITNLAFGGFQDVNAPSTSTVTISGTGSLSLNSGLQGFNNGGGPMTINVPINGTGGIAFESGNCTLGVANGYTGGTQLGFAGNPFAGIVFFSNASAFGSGAITLTQYGNGAALVVGTTSALTIANNFTVSSATTNNFVGNVNGVTYGGTWSLGANQFNFETGATAGNVDIISGVISGTAGLIVSDAGTLKLTGVNTYTGNTTISSPAVLVIGGTGGGGQLNSGSYANNIINAGTFTYNSTANQTLSGAFSSVSGTFNVNGSGTLTLSGGADNNSLGANVNNGGKLVLGKTSTSGVHALGAATTVNSGGTLQLGGSGGDQIYDGVTITVASGGVFDLNGQTETFTTLNLSGTGISSGGALINSGGTASTLTCSSGITLAADSSMGGSGSITLPSVISGAHALTYVGPGTLTLSGANTYSGITTINNGLLAIIADNNLGAAPGSATANQLTLNNTSTGNYGLRCTATISLSANRGITLGANGGSIQVSTGNTLTVPGIIAGSSGGGLMCGTTPSVGEGTLVLSGANTYNGPTSVASGTLQLGASGSLPSTTALTVASAAVGGIFSLANFNQTIGSLASSTGINGTGTTTPTVALGSGALTVNQSSSTTFAGVISGSGGSLTKSGSGTLTLSGANTYTGNTSITAGTLALGSSGSINNTPLVSVSAGATFDVSAISSYTLSSSTTLSASGTGTTVGSTAAAIKGGTTVSLGSRPISLTFTPTAFTGDTAHPALYISQGTLSLNGNAFTVNNASGTALNAGTYRLVQQASGSITSAGSYSVSVTGSGLISGATASIQVSGGNVNLVMMATPTYSGLTSSQSITYGAASVTLGGKLSATGPIYPPNGETVTVTINGNAQTTTINDSTGDFSINYNLSGLVYSPNAYTITYSYAGDATFNSASDTSKTLTVNAPTAPSITTQPQPQSACSGSPATFTGGASGGSDSYAWYKHSNAGWGSTWTTSGGGSTFLQTSAQNNNGVGNCNSFSSYGDINTPGGNSWGLYGGGGESVSRVFPAGLTNGQVFQIDMDNGGVDSGVQNGFSLQTSGGTFLMSFYFLGSGSDYIYYDTSAHTTTVGFTRTGLRVTVIVGEGSPATYSLKITPCGGSTVDYTGTFAAAGAPGKVVVYNNNTSGGDANNLYFNSMFAGSAYDNADNYSGNWGGSDKGDTTPISGATGTSYTTSVGSNGDLYYVIAYNGAGYAASTNALLTVNPIPAQTITVASSVCAGSTGNTASVSTTSGATYAWSITGGTITAGGSSSTVTYTAGTGSAVTLSCVVTSSAGCASAGGQNTSVTINAIPAQTITPTASSVCAGSTGNTASVTTTSGATYAWSITGGTITAGGSSSTVTYSAGSGSAVTLNCVVTSSAGCASAGGQNTSVTINAIPAQTITAASSVCAGSTGNTASVSTTSGATYAWSITGGTITAGGSSSTVTYSAGSGSAVTLNCVVTSSAGCASAGNQGASVTVNPAPTVTTDTTNQTACAGSQVMWSVVASGTGIAYQWQRDGTNLLEGVENFTGTTTAILTNSAVASQDGVAAAHGYACVISIGTCSVTSTLASLTVNPLPTVSVNSTTICAGGSATLTATTSASSPSYLWNDPGNSTTASITVSPASTTTYTVTVTDGTTTCANSGSGTVTVNPLPTVSVNSATICAGGSATLTATTSASSPSYLWNDPGNSTTASITVSPASTTTYTVTVTDGTTTCANSGSGTVTVNPLPTVSVNSAAICAGGSATLTATTSASSPSYLWNDPGNSTTASITVSPASTTTYTVTVTNGTTGCANSGSGTVTVNAVPSAPTAGSDSPVYGSTLHLTASTVGGATYAWTGPNGFSSSDQNPTITNVTMAASGEYSVTATVNGCTSSAGTTTVTINQASTSNGVTASPNPSLPGSNVTFTATLAAVAPGAGTPTGTVLFKTNGVPLADPVTLDTNGVATLITNSLPHGSNTVFAEYAGDGNFLGSTNSVVQIVNTPPVAPNTNGGVTENSSLVLSVAKLLSLAHDADGDTLSITSAGPTSTNGGTVTLAGGSITYVPVTNFVGTDLFSFVVSDSYGASSTGTVLVAVSAANVPSPNIVVPPAFDSGSGTFSVTFAGIPGYVYTVQWAPTVTGEWSFLKSATSGPDGLFEVLDTPDPVPPSRYYRTVYP